MQSQWILLSPFSLISIWLINFCYDLGGPDELHQGWIVKYKLIIRKKILIFFFPNWSRFLNCKVNLQIYLPMACLDEVLCLCWPEMNKTHLLASITLGTLVKDWNEPITSDCYYQQEVLNCDLNWNYQGWYNEKKAYLIVTDFQC